MKKQIAFYLTMVVVLTVVGVAVPQAGSESVNTLRAYYENRIDTCIQKLDNKAGYLDSDSQVLRHEALRAAMKKVFFQF